MFLCEKIFHEESLWRDKYAKRYVIFIWKKYYLKSSYGIIKCIHDKVSFTIVLVQADEYP